MLVLSKCFIPSKPVFELHGCCQISHSFSNEPSITERLQIVQNRYLPNISHELNRLNANPAIYEKIKNFNEFYGSNPRDVLVSFGRVLEVLEEVTHSHYVFSHGASRRQLCLNILNMTLASQNESVHLTPFDILLRHPSLFSEEKEPIEWYKKNIKRESKKTDDSHRQFLVSADYILTNSSHNESAISHVLSPRRLVNKIYSESLSHVISHAIHSREASRSFTERFEKIASKIYLKEESFELFGDLYAICIPKQLFSSCGYIAKPYGVAMELPHDEKTELKKGQAMSSFIEPYERDPVPQVRLLARTLASPHNEIKTLVFPTMTDPALFEITNLIKNLVLENKSLEY